VLEEVGGLGEVGRVGGAEEDDFFWGGLCFRVEEDFQVLGLWECFEWEGERAAGVEGDDGAGFSNPELVVG